MTDEINQQCLESYAYETLPEMRLAYALQTLFNFALSTVIFHAVKTRKKRHVPAHPNFKIIILNATIAVWLFSIASAIASSVALFNSLRATRQNCATLMHKTTCLLMKIPYFFPVPMFTGVHVMLFVERSIAFLRRSSYEKQMRIMGVAFTLFAWSFCWPFEVGVIGNVDASEMISHCTVIGTGKVAIYASFLEITSLVDIGTTMGDLILRCRARRKAKQTVNYNNYTLSNAYQRKENLRLMTMMVPISTVFATGHLVYSVAALGMERFVPYYAELRFGKEVSAKDLERLAVAGFELNVSIFTALLFTVTRMYIRIGEKLMDEKKITVDQPNTDVTFSMFEDQMKSHLSARNLVLSASS